MSIFKEKDMRIGKLFFNPALNAWDILFPDFSTLGGLSAGVRLRILVDFVWRSTQYSIDCYGYPFFKGIDRRKPLTYAKIAM